MRWSSQISDESNHGAWSLDRKKTWMEKGKSLNRSSFLCLPQRGFVRSSKRQDEILYLIAIRPDTIVTWSNKGSFSWIISNLTLYFLGWGLAYFLRFPASSEFHPMVSHQSLPSSPNPEGLEPNRAEWLIPSIEMRKVLFFYTVWTRT